MSSARKTRTPNLRSKIRATATTGHPGDSGCPFLCDNPASALVYAIERNVPPPNFTIR
jgi:hypothetical protein